MREPLSPPPTTRRDDVREVLHGVEVADPYRWLEDASSPETREWIARQQEYAARYFAATHRERIRKRMVELLDTDEIGIPWERGGYFYFSRRLADQQRHSIWRRFGLDGPDELLVDPSEISADPTFGIELRDVTPDGILVCYLVRHGGEDEAEIRVTEVVSRRCIDLVPRAKQGVSGWKHDNSGYFYSLWADAGSQLRFHRIGTHVTEDREVLRTNPGEWLIGSVSDDGRYLLVHAWHGSAGERTRVYLKDLGADGPVRAIIEGLDAHSMAAIAGGAMVIATNWKAPNYRVMRAELSNLDRDSWREIIPERSAAIQGLVAVGGKLVVTYVENALSRVCVFTVDGAPLPELELPAPGTVSGARGPHGLAEVHGRWDGNEAFFTFQTFDRPPAVWRHNLATSERQLWSRQLPELDPSRFEIRQVWYASRDGTRVPMFIFHRRGLKLDGARPTMLHGYGGFKGNTTPFFLAPAIAWAEAGGVFASASIRGGGEFGLSWHEAGRLGNKQNVFDDFIAAAEWLISNHYTKPSKLAVIGDSNGGLLVGAVMTQRPELFGAVLCVRPLLDMIRYHKFSIAALWVPEYGSSDSPDQFAYLIKYSPYQNVRSGVRYPSTLLVTGDLDTRVDPMHARKMTAALQAATSADRPIVLRYGTEAGHTGAAALDTIIDELTDFTAFLGRELEVSF